MRRPDCLVSARSVILLNPQELKDALEWDISETDTVDGWVYSADENFLIHLLETHRHITRINIIADWKHRHPWEHLANRYPELRVHTWPTNRTMHAKGFLLHPADIFYLLTANMHLGSFRLSRNLAARISHSQAVDRATYEFEQDWAISTPLPSRQTPPSDLP